MRRGSGTASAGAGRAGRGGVWAGPLSHGDGAPKTAGSMSNGPIARIPPIVRRRGPKLW